MDEVLFSISLYNLYTYPEPKQLIANPPLNQLMFIQVPENPLTCHFSDSQHIQVGIVIYNLKALPQISFI